MELTQELKKKIDNQSHFLLLWQIRFGRSGAPIFQGESGDYFMKTYAKKRDANREQAVIDSKKMGWG